jgi:WD40 repeat protein
MKVYDGSKLVNINSFQAHSYYVARIKQSPFNNGQLVATCSDDRTVKIWDSTSNWSEIRTYTGHAVYALDWIDEDTIASGSLEPSDGTIKLWSISSGQTQRTINASASVWSLKLLSNGIHLAAGFYSGNITIYNINNGSLVSTLQGHTQVVRDLIQINGDLMASTSGYPEQTVRIWNLTSNTCKFILQGHTNDANSLIQISSDLLASGSFDATIKLWDITNGALIRTLTGHTGSIHWSLNLFNYGQQTRLVSGDFNGEVKVWNFETGECLVTIKTGSSIGGLAVLENRLITSNMNILFLLFRLI